MDERDAAKVSAEHLEQLEKRLQTFYGSSLDAQPLSEASWQRLAGQLQRPRYCRLKQLMHRRISRRRLRRPEPFDAPDIQGSYQRRLNEIGMASRSVRLRYAFKSRLRTPALHIKSWPRPAMMLHIPASVNRRLDQSELDVLLVTGLARAYSLYKPLYLVLFQLLFIGAMIGVVWSDLSHSLWRAASLFLIALMIVIVWFAWEHQRRRKAAFQADQIAVRWLGRTRICHGLHLLAERGSMSRWRSWGEPSLEERIQRVCGTRVIQEDERLTLVR